ncbi:MAG: helix-turn-helix transcriptional regulator [Bosea sp.]|uniref:helix-turn-helix domain-containing protein n=1 Tax=Bosea sp. (in: a-proteobacteria) TaxID=1871050 RepID=UPI002389D2BD|nr:helix-turn-helix transcriptional regulator [Bosea sp. (in: a-proteobacteria)]
MPANRNKNIYTIRTNVRAAIEVFENISQAADQLNINRQQLTKYISGTMSPSIQTLSRIGSYFNCEIDDFLLNKNDFIYKINFKNTLSDNFSIAKNSFNQLVDQASLSS